MAVNYVKTYGDLSQEAQRQQRLAEMLQQQAQEPTPQYSYQGIQAMPSYANAIAKLLSSYGAERARRKAEETQQLAKKVGREEFSDYMTALQPTERKLGTAMDVVSARPEDQAMAAMLPQNLDTAEIAKSIGAPTAGVAPQGAAPAFQAPQFAVGGAPMTLAQRRAKLLEGLGSENPMIQAAAQAEFAKKPEEFDIKETSQGLMRVGKSTGAVSPLLGPNGMPLTPRDAYSMGMTPDQKAKYDLDVRKFGVEVANARLSQRQAADQGVDVSGLGLPGVPPTVGTAPPTAPVRPPRPGQATATGQPPAPAQTTGQPPAPQANVPLINNPQIAPKQKRELLMAQPQAKAAATNMQSSIANINNMTDDLLGHSGLDKISGPFGQVKLTDLSPEARSARAIYDSAKGQVALLRVAMARAEGSGGAYGNLTEKEWPRLENALGAIELAQDGDSLRNALSNFKNVLNGLSENTKSVYENTYGKLDFTPPKYNPENKRFPRQSSAPQQSRGWGKVEVVGGD